jgi:hypothetical protein
MAELLFTSPSELAETTILGGNVDIDKYTFNILSVQISVIEPLLGTLLYDKIVTDLTADNLSGLYLTLYNEFIKPITKHEAVAEYIEVCSYTLDNGGLYKHQPDNAEVVDKEEAQFLAGKYHAVAQMYIQRFEKWICKNQLTEYKCYQDEVNARKDMKLTAGWYLGGREYDKDSVFPYGGTSGDFLELE